MDQKDIIEIAEGLRQIEQGVMKIQGVMRSKNIKSLHDVAAELIPLFKQHDDELTESVIQKLNSNEIVKRG